MKKPVVQTTYTNAPWRLVGRDVYNGETVHVAKIMSTNANLGPKTKTEVEANAFLIAAAPEMLSALLAVLELMEFEDNTPAINPRAREYVVSVKEHIIKTIKKAGGDI